jgi:hypothetical protein
VSACSDVCFVVAAWQRMFPQRAQHEGRVRTVDDWAQTLRTTALAKLREAYKAIPPDLHVRYPLRSSHRMPPDIVYSATRPNSERQVLVSACCILPKCPLTGHCNRSLAAIGKHLGPGFPRVVMLRRQCLHTLKSEYRARYCNPLHQAYPKLIEVRSRLETPPPAVGDYLEIEGLCGAIVKQVGGFDSLQSWEKFPCKGPGGIALDSAQNVHDIPGLREADFTAGNVWWALLEFPY